MGDVPFFVQGDCSMLVLSRQRDESIMIGDNVVITVVDIRGDKVRLGIQAPHEIPVHRREVYEAIQKENLQAAQLDRTDVRGLGGVIPPPSREAGREGTRRG
jgi:carbon storage regulator